MAESASGAASLVTPASAVVRTLSQILAAELTDAESARDKLLAGLRDLEQAAQRLGFGLEDTHHAKYALVGLIDERILLSDLALKDTWLERPLQLQLFDDFSAGEEFYNKLDAARHGASPNKAAVLEVFHLCLALGFQGKHGDRKGAERRRILIDGLATEILGQRASRPDAPLSPQVEPDLGTIAPTRALALLERGPLWLPPVLAVSAVVVISLLLGWLGAAGLSGLEAIQAASGEVAR